MKKLFAAILAITMILSSAVICVSAETTDSWADYAATAWYDDADANATTYTIKTAADLAGLAKLVDGGNAFVGKTINVDATTIDLSAHYWEPIGAEATPFQGTFDGNGVTISGMKIDSAETEQQALFATLSSTTEGVSVALQNFSLINSSVTTSGTNYSALVVGKLYTNQAVTLTLKNIYAQGTVTSTLASGSSYIGGIGSMIYTSVTNATVAFENIVCDVDLAYTGGGTKGYIGGLLGQTGSNATDGCFNITNSVYLGSITGSPAYAGGAIGWNNYGNGNTMVTITNFLNAAEAISATTAKGAFVGISNRAKQQYTFNTSVYSTELEAIGSSSTTNVTTNNCYVIGDGDNEISADQINVFSNILTTASTLTGYANVEKTMEGLVAACNAVAKTSGLCALQISTQEAGNPYSVRFIAKLDTTDYVRAGIKVSINGVEKIMDTTTVYTEISAYTENGTIASYTAQKLGATYLYAAGVYNIPANAENVVITVTPYTVAMVEETETTVEGEAYEITFNKGVYVGAEKVEKAA